MSPDAILALDPAGTTHSEVSPTEWARPLTVEQLIREARQAGCDGSQRRLSRLAWSYVSARTNGECTAWLRRDPTLKAVLRNLERGGGDA